jgi:hypothetical protein
MTRKILTIAASSLAFSAFAFAPLTAQATSGSVFTNLGSGTTIEGTAISSVDVTSVTADIPLGRFDPETGVPSADYTFHVAFNGTGYKVLFSSQNASGSNFELSNGLSALIPYTVIGSSTDMHSYAYKSGEDISTPSLADANPAFTVAVPAIALSTALPAGLYSDVLTVTVTAV